MEKLILQELNNVAIPLKWLCDSNEKRNPLYHYPRKEVAAAVNELIKKRKAEITVIGSGQDFFLQKI